MPLAARENDSCSTGHSGASSTNIDTPINNSTVFIEGELAARLDDPTDSHSTGSGSHTATITSASSHVYIRGKRAARLGDSVDSGTITGSASYTYIG